MARYKLAGRFFSAEHKTHERGEILEFVPGKQPTGAVRLQDDSDEPYEAPGAEAEGTADSEDDGDEEQPESADDEEDEE